MMWVAAILAILGVTCLAWGLYMVFSPAYNTTEDYMALLPLGAGVILLVLAALVWGGVSLFRHFA